MESQLDQSVSDFSTYVRQTIKSTIPDLAESLESFRGELVQIVCRPKDLVPGEDAEAEKEYVSRIINEVPEVCGPLVAILNERKLEGSSMIFLLPIRTTYERMLNSVLGQRIAKKIRGIIND
jgi:hypothetical protein